METDLLVDQTDGKEVEALAVPRQGSHGSFRGDLSLDGPQIIVGIECLDRLDGFPPATTLNCITSQTCSPIFRLCKQLQQMRA